MTDDRLRSAYERLVDRSSPTDREGCPSPESLRDLVEKRGPEADRLRTLDHVMACRHCRPELELLRATDRAAPRESPALWSRRAALAAGIAIALAGGAVWLMPWNAGPPVFREGSTTPTSLVEPAGTLADRPRRLVWRSVEDAVRYEVEILREGGALVHRASTGDTVLSLPSSVELAAETTYTWRAEVVLLGGTRRTLGNASFTIERPGA